MLGVDTVGFVQSKCFTHCTITPDALHVFSHSFEVMVLKSMIWGFVIAFFPLVSHLAVVPTWANKVSGIARTDLGGMMMNLI